MEEWLCHAIFISNVNYLYEELEDLGEVYSDEKKFKCLYNMLPSYLCITSNMIFHQKKLKIILMAYMMDVVPTLKQLQKQKGIIRNRENNNTKPEAKLH